jgi:hypothetical protein
MIAPPQIVHQGQGYMSAVSHLHQPQLLLTIVCWLQLQHLTTDGLPRSSAAGRGSAAGLH